MSTINPASLYSQNEGIFNARPYVWHEEQLAAHQAAKDDALSKYYQNLPNTLNEKGLRDIDVPGVNAARNEINKNFIQNKRNILKGNTPETYNYEKQVRDLQGKIQEGLNAAQISTKIANLKVDPNKASMFYGDDKFNEQQKHNLSVFDKDRVGIDLTNFTATPKEYTDADLSKEMSKYKPAGLEDLIKEPDPTDNTKEIVRSVPKYDATQLDQMKLSSLYKYSNNVSYKQKVDQMVSSPSAKPLLDNLFQHYYNREPSSANEYSMAYDLSKLPITAEKRTIVTNGQQKINAANAENDRRAARNQGYKQANIALNQNAAAAGLGINDVYNKIDQNQSNGDININYKKGGNLIKTVKGARFNSLPNDAQQILMPALRAVDKNANVSNVYTIREDDGSIGIYKTDDKNEPTPSVETRITTISRTGINLKAQADSKGKKAVVAQGEPNKSVPVQQKIKLTSNGLPKL